LRSKSKDSGHASKDARASDVIAPKLFPSVVDVLQPPRSLQDAIGLRRQIASTFGCIRQRMIRAPDDARTGYVTVAVLIRESESTNGRKLLKDLQFGAA
jgi:hypothetical protein